MVPPPDGFLKINTEESTRGNPGVVGIGGVGRDSRGNVRFLFSIHMGVQSNNQMEPCVILKALDQAIECGWQNVIYEADSMILVSRLNKRYFQGLVWRLVLIVKKILHLASKFEHILFIHIPREWNRVVDCLAKWASECRGFRMWMIGDN